MRTIKVWMTYTGRSEIEVEVADDFVVPPHPAEWPDGWLTDLDASLVEMSPDDWGYSDAH